MRDLIDRQAAIDDMKNMYQAAEKWGREAVGDAIKARAESCMATLVEMKLRIEKLPSAQPEPQWIPCSERLPEEKKDVLIAFKHNMAVGFWEDILDNGEHVWYANSGDGWMTDTANVDSDGIPIAWMPLPEPYKEVE